jgi:hypothetical protein
MIRCLLVYNITPILILPILTIREAVAIYSHLNDEVLPKVQILAKLQLLL